MLLMNAELIINGDFLGDLQLLAKLADAWRQPSGPHGCWSCAQG